MERPMCPRRERFSRRGRESSRSVPPGRTTWRRRRGGPGAPDFPPRAIRRGWGTRKVTTYWCSTGMAGSRIPTASPVAWAWLPVAVTTCSVRIAKASPVVRVPPLYTPFASRHALVRIDMLLAVNRERRGFVLPAPWPE